MTTGSPSADAVLHVRALLRRTHSLCTLGNSGFECLTTLSPWCCCCDSAAGAADACSEAFLGSSCCCCSLAGADDDDDADALPSGEISLGTSIADKSSPSSASTAMIWPTGTCCEPAAD